MRSLLKKRLKLTKNQKGMTLIELMAVVVILGILAAVAGVAVVNSFDKAKTNSTASTEAILKDAAQRYIMDNSTSITTTDTTITIASLVNGGYLRETPKNSSGTPYTNVLVKKDASGALVFTFSTT